MSWFGNSVNRFLAKRTDYPCEDPKKLEELSQRVVMEMAAEMPSLVSESASCDCLLPTFRLVVIV